MIEEENLFLREKISGKIVGRYTEAVKSMYDKMNSSQDKSETMMLGVKIKQLNKNILLSCWDNSNWTWYHLR